MKKGLKGLLKYVRKVVLYLIFFSIGLVVLYRFINPPFTPLMAIRFFEQAFGPYDIRYNRDYKSLKDISTNLQKAVIASEDQKFPIHIGFDFIAMEKAYKGNKNGKKIKGASTISQQVAKNVFLWPGRSYIRKMFEAYFTILIELFWSKERILEVYLNVIEIGNGIYGSEAAARYYFNKPAGSLTKGESALIAAILPNPRKWSASKPTAYILKKQVWILKNMKTINLAALK